LLTVERQAGTSLRCCRQKTHDGQRQEPPYLPGELLVEEPEKTFFAVLADPTRTTAAGTARSGALFGLAIAGRL
jgi:hypothetical protein